MSLVYATYHHCAANDGMGPRECDHGIFNGHVGHTIFASGHVAQVSNMPDINIASEASGLISI